jgi:hypothetical protein
MVADKAKRKSQELKDKAKEAFDKVTKGLAKSGMTRTAHKRSPTTELGEARKSLTTGPAKRNSNKELGVPSQGLLLIPRPLPI